MWPLETSLAVIIAIFLSVTLFITVYCISYMLVKGLFAMFSQISDIIKNRKSH